MVTVEIEGQKMAMSKAQAKELFYACHIAKELGRTIRTCGLKFDVDAYVDEELGQMYAIRKNNKTNPYWLCLTEQGLAELKMKSEVA